MEGYQPKQIAQALRQAPAQMGGGPLGRGRAFQQGGSPAGQPAAQGEAVDWGSMMQNGKKLWDAGSSLFGTTGADIGAGAQQYGPEVAKMGGNVTGGAGGMMSAAGPIAGAVLGGLATDNLLNESDKDKWYNADKINSYGTVNMGGKDIGLRGGDFINGINPATWLSDPKKGANGLLNAFTFGIFD